MGFLLNDVLIIAKHAASLKKRNNIFTLANPKSYVFSKQLKSILNESLLKKYNLDLSFFSKKYFNKLKKIKKDVPISFKFFSKLINFKNFYSIDMNPNEKASFVIDITNKNKNKKLISNADIVYDSGSLGYVNDPVKGLDFLRKLVSKDGIIIHQSPHNNFNIENYFQFNKNFFKDYYSKYNFDIIENYYGFNSSWSNLNFRSWINKSITGGGRVDVTQKKHLIRLKKEKCMIYSIVKKNN